MNCDECILSTYEPPSDKHWCRRYEKYVRQDLSCELGEEITDLNRSVRELEEKVNEMHEKTQKVWELVDGMTAPNAPPPDAEYDDLPF